MNTELEVRELRAADADALYDFFNAIPAEGRTFFFQDVTDPEVSEDWAGNERLLRRAVFDEQGQIVAFAALRPGVEWSSHVADLVLVVSPDHRRRGLGRALARQMLVEALEHEFQKVTVKIAANNEGAIDMFRKLGFEGEALLRDHLRSPQDGTLRDVVLLAHLVDETWSSMLTGGFQEALG